MEFMAGIILGGFMVLCITEYRRVKSRIISDRYAEEKNTENRQWNNLMNYDGTERRQNTGED